MTLHPHTYGEGECDAPDAAHVVLSFDVDAPYEQVVWVVLPNHAEWLVAAPAVEEYATDAEGVEAVSVHLANMRTGAELEKSVRDDLVDLRRD